MKELLFFIFQISAFGQTSPVLVSTIPAANNQPIVSALQQPITSTPLQAPVVASTPQQAPMVASQKVMMGQAPQQVVQQVPQQVIAAPQQVIAAPQQSTQQLISSPVQGATNVPVSNLQVASTSQNSVIPQPQQQPQPQMNPSSLTPTTPFQSVSKVATDSPPTAKTPTSSDKIQCISLKGSRNCPQLDGYLVYPTTKYNNLEGLDKYLDSTKYNSSFMITTFQSQLQCPRFTGRGGRYGMSAFCAYIVSDSQTKCAPEYPANVKPLTLCAPICKMHMDSIKDIMSTSKFCDPSPMQSVQSLRDSVLKPKGNLAEYCDSLASSSTANQNTCWPGLRSEFAQCGFQFEDEALEYCNRTPTDMCCTKAFMNPNHPLNSLNSNQTLTSKQPKAGGSLEGKNPLEETGPESASASTEPVSTTPTSTSTALPENATTNSAPAQDHSGMILGVIAIILILGGALGAFLYYYFYRNKSTDKGDKNGRGTRINRTSTITVDMDDDDSLEYNNYNDADDGMTNPRETFKFDSKMFSINKPNPTVFTNQRPMDDAADSEFGLSPSLRFPGRTMSYYSNV